MDPRLVTALSPPAARAPPAPSFVPITTCDSTTTCGLLLYFMTLLQPSILVKLTRKDTLPGLEGNKEKKISVCDFELEVCHTFTMFLQIQNPSQRSARRVVVRRVARYQGHHLPQMSGINADHFLFAGVSLAQQSWVTVSTVSRPALYLPSYLCTVG